MSPLRVSSVRLILALLLALTLLPTAQAQTKYYWDGSTTGGTGNGLSDGAAGTWDTTTLNWDRGSGLTRIAWPNGTGSDAGIAVFGRTGTAGGTVTLAGGSPISIGGLTFYGHTFTIAAGTVGLNFNGTNNAVTLFGNSGTTIGNTITGTVGGTGNFILNSANPGVASTLTFSGISAGGWSGTTTINANSILTTTTTSGNVNQVLNSTSGITLNGGTIQFNRATNAQLSAISDSAAITVNGGGAFGVTSADAGGANANETIGAVTLNSGQMNFNWTNSPSSGGQIILTGLSRSGTASAAFSGTHNASGGRWKVNGAGTTTAGEIIGPWYTTGGANAGLASTDYAVFSSDFIAPAAIAASAESTWSTAHAATANFTMSAIASGTISGGGRNVNTIRSLNNSVAVTASNPDITLTGHTLSVGDVVTFSAGTMPAGLTAGTPYYVVATGANTIQVSATPGGTAITPTTAGATVFAAGGIQVSAGNNLGTFGILNGSTTTLNILQSGGGGSVTLPTTSAGNLFVTAGSGAITISAPIVNNTGALTLVKNGSNTLTLSGTNTYTGGTVINAGTLSIGNVNNIGGVGASLTFGGSGTLTNTAALNFSSGTLTVNQGANATINSGAATAVTFATTTGSGNLIFNMNHNTSLNLGDASGFTGNVQAKINGNINQSGAASLTFTKLADAVGSYLQFAGGQSDSNQTTNIVLQGDAGPLTFNNRVVQMLPRTASNWVSRDSILSNNNTNAANTWVINTALDWEYTTSSNPGSRNFVLSGSNTGDNAFNGLISDGNTNGSAALNLTKTGTGKWIVSGNNTFSGGVTVSGGTLVLSGLNQHTGGTTLDNGTLIVNTIKDFGVASSIGKPASGAILVERYNGTKTLSYTGTGDTSNRNFKFQGYSISDLPALTLKNDGTGALIFTAGTFNEYSTSSNRIFTLNLGGTYTGGTNEIQGTIQNHFTGASDVLNLTKNDDSIWKLSGNNTYTGTTKITGGTLSITSIGNVGGGASAVGAPTTVGNGTIAIGSTTSAGTLVYTGTGNTTDRVINLAGSTGGATLDQSGTGLLKFNSAFTATGTGSKTLTLQGSTAGTGEIAGAIVDNSGTNKTSLTKSGTGTWALSGTNTYTGTTSITGGTLLVNGNNSAATGAITVANTATLGGTGTIGGATTVQSGGTVAPGASSGTLTINANTVLSSGSAYAFELSTAGSSAGANSGTSSPGGSHTSHDVLAVTGTLTLTGSTINITSLGTTGLNSANSYSWLIATATGGITGTPTLGTVAGTDFTSSGGTFSLNVTGSNLYLNFQPVPEPASVLAVGVGLLGAVSFIRKRRKKTCPN